MPRPPRHIARACIVVLLCAIALAHGAVAHAQPDDESEYFRQKRLGNYDRALEIASDRIMRHDDPIRAEIELVRLFELAETVELVDSAIAALARAESAAPALRASAVLRARAATLRAQLELRRGSGSAVTSAIDGLGFLTSCDALGPFHNRGGADFNAMPVNAQRPFDPPASRGRSGEARWFPARTGLTGVFAIDNYFKDIDNTFVLLRTVRSVPADGAYQLFVGKTGYCDIWIDGTRVFSNRREHSFFHDQYRISARLTKGAHAILVKIGAADGDGIRVSLRLTDADGRAVPAPVSPHTAIERGSAPAAVSSSLFPSAAGLSNFAAQDPMAAFRLGYLLQATGLAGKSIEEVRALFQRSLAVPVPARWYLAMIEKTAEQREAHLHECLRAHKDHIEALTELAHGKIRTGFLYEAAPLIEAIGRENRASFKYPIVSARLFEAMGWHTEGLRLSREAQRSRYPSTGRAIEGIMHLSRGDNAAALPSIEWHYNRERGNPVVIDRLVRCLTATGDLDRATSVLTHSLVLYPDDPNTLIRLIDIIEQTQGPGAAVPYLGALLQRAPQHAGALMRLGLVYHRLGNDALARHYLARALRHDQGNVALKRYLTIIENRPDPLDGHAVRDDIRDLARAAARHRDEAAVILIDETMIRVLPDGSYEHRVRKAVLINDRSALDEFTRQYIVYSPETDSIEDIDCGVINDGTRTAVTAFYDRSLSDPESRLFYDVKAKVIPLPSLGPGSIIDLRYTRISRVGEIYKGYFGERIPVGGEHRTLVFNCVLAHPRDKSVYPHLRGIDGSPIATTVGPADTVHRLHLRDRAPYKKESLMPHRSELVPMLYFTTFRNWTEAHGWYRSLVKDRMTMSAEMRDALRTAVAGASGRDDTIRRIYNHVNAHIRYVGFELGIGGIRPRHADQTYHTRMGDCKDISLVLAAFLRAAGIDANLALVRTRDNGPANLAVPYLGDFNHAICHVDANGPLFLDGTAKLAGMSELPSTDRAITAFVVGDRRYRFIDTAHRRYAENRDDVTNDVYLTPAGDARIVRTLSKRGSYAVGSRSELQDREKKRASISAYWNERYPGATISPPEYGAAEPDEPMVYRYTITVPSFLETDGAEMVFGPFFSASNYYSTYAMLRSRTHPVVFTTTFSSDTLIRYHLPQGFSPVSVPKSEQFVTDDCEARFRFVAREGVIEVVSHIAFKAHRIPIGSYARFRDFTRFVNRKENEKIIIRRNGP